MLTERNGLAIAKRVSARWLLVVLAALQALALSAQDAQFVTQVSPNPVTEGDRFQISYILNTEGRNFIPPSFSGIQILSGPNTSTSMRIYNGTMVRQISYSYVAVANSTGRVTIPGASIVADNKRLQSNDVTLMVVEPSAAEKQRREAEAQRQEQITQQAEQIIRENIYVTTDISKRKVYKGEQIVATYKLYVNADLNVIALEPEANPSFTGFWTQDFDQDMSKWQNERISGAYFRTLVIKKVVLIPTRTGELNIEPMSFNSTVRLRTGGRRSMFDDFFSRGSYQDFNYTIKSPRVTITSKELPSGAPESFNGAVGSFQMEAFFDKTEVPADEPLSLKINISGNGNLKLVESPEVSFPPDFEVFDPKVADNVSITTAGSKGNMQFEYLAIPRNPGQYTIDPVEFTYFDLATEEYKTLRSEEFQLKIGKGTGEGTTVFGSGKSEIELLSSDINYIRTELGDKDSNDSIFGSFLFILLTVSPLVLFIILFVFRKKKNEEQGDYYESRRRGASKVAKKRLSAAESHMKKNEQEAFYVEINRAVWGYLSEKLAIPVSDLTFALAEKKLAERGIENEQINSIKAVIDTSEMARYAPSSVGGSMAEIYSKAKNSITSLEEKLK